MDIKTGVTIVLLFALFNKVAGVYGLVAIFTGGTLAQVSLYMYSIATLVLFFWGMRAVSEENPKDTFYFAHMFACDHIFSTLWLGYFSVLWWVYTDHNGARTPHSAAQDALIESAKGIPVLSDDDRAREAQALWQKEKGFAGVIIVAGWLLKIYFALLLYSYALHLRRGSYRTLENSYYTRVPPSATNGAFDLSGHPDDDFEYGEAPASPGSFNYRGRIPGTASSFSEFVTPTTPNPKRDP